MTAHICRTRRDDPRLGRRVRRRGVGKGTRVGLIMPNCVQWVQIAVALTRIGAVLVPLSTLLQPPGARRALRARQYSACHRAGVPRPPLSRRLWPSSGRIFLRCARCGLPTNLPRATDDSARRCGRRNRHAQRHPRDHVHVGQQRPTQRGHPLARQCAGCGAVRPGGPLHRCRHQAVPADAVLLGGWIRQSVCCPHCWPAPRWSPSRYPRPETTLRLARTRTCHPVPWLAGSSGGAGTPNRFRGSRSVITASRQPGGVCCPPISGPNPVRGRDCSG